MLSFRLQYQATPLIRYTLQSGLVNKPRAYKFNYSTGGSKGTYHFVYDRRDQIHIEEIAEPLVKWGNELNIDKWKMFQSLVLKIGGIEIEKSSLLSSQNRIKIMEYLDSITRLISDTSYMENDCSEISLKVKNNHNIHIYRDLIELWRRLIYEIEGEFEETFLVYDCHKVYEDFREHFISILNAKNLDIYKNIQTLSYGVYIIGTIEEQLKLIDSIKKLSVFKDNENTRLECESKEIDFEDFNDIKINLNQNKGLCVEEEKIKLVRGYKELNLDNIKKMLSGMSPKELWVEWTENLLKIIELEDLPNKVKEIEIFYEYLSVHKKLRDMYKENLDKTMRNKINQLGVINWSYLLELTQKKLTTTSDLVLELLDIYETLIFNERSLDALSRDLNIEKYNSTLKKLPNGELDIEFQERVLKLLVDILIDFEKTNKGFDLVTVWDAMIEKHEKINGKSIISIFDMDISNWESLFENIVSQYVNLEYASEILKKTYRNQNMIVGKEEEFRKNYQEITTKKWESDLGKMFAGSILIEKREEYEKIKRELDLIDDEFKIQFYKRFWFLRATEPRDWKILPEIDYPYEIEPLNFGSSMGRPENWQLDMVPDYSEKVNNHPIPEGSSWGLWEMGVSIEIMIDMLNIAILLWARMYYNFSGYTGPQAMHRFIKIIYDWFILDTSQKNMEDKNSKDDYYRIYRWMRWEAEKVILLAKDDFDLNGNMYIENFLWELIYYMENHHFDAMPLFDMCDWMDEYRNMLSTDEPQGDIKFVLDKVKGMRHKIIEGRVNKNNE